MKRYSDEELFTLLKSNELLTPSENSVTRGKAILTKRARRNSLLKHTHKGLIMTASIVSALAIFVVLAIQVIPIQQKKESNLHVAQALKSEPEILIYHTHNTESFLPVLQIDDPNQAVHETVNITLVGKNLKKEFEKRGILAIHRQDNVNGELKEKGWRYSDSYKVTRSFVKDILEKNKDIQYVFDVHRDSQKRNATTLETEDDQLAKISIVVSEGYNKEEAEKVHETLELHQSGISRGVFIQGGATRDNQSYNQDLHPNSLLIQIGGVENTLEETYKTTEILAEVITELMSE